MQFLIFFNEDAYKCVPYTCVIKELHIDCAALASEGKRHITLCVYLPLPLISLLNGLQSPSPLCEHHLSNRIPSYFCLILFAFEINTRAFACPRSRFFFHYIRTSIEQYCFYGLPRHIHIHTHPFRSLSLTFSHTWRHHFDTFHHIRVCHNSPQKCATHIYVFPFYDPPPFFFSYLIFDCDSLYSL
jgi:hypothetical protein